jgi:phage terminase Nu1 subunit (DNA packaging protein)
MALTIDQATAAEIAGITVRRLQQIDKAKDGPKRNARGKYLVSHFGSWLKERHKHEFGVAGDGKAYDLDAERARLAKAQADKQELDNRAKQGDLIPLAVIERVLASLFTDIRTNGLAIPSRLKQELGLDEAGEATIAKAVTEWLQSTANWRLGSIGDLAGGGDQVHGHGATAAASNGQSVGGSAPNPKP